MFQHYTNLLKSQSSHFSFLKITGSINAVHDNTINDFYRMLNGGGFYSNSLLIYPLVDNFLSIEKINEVVNRLYGKYVGNRFYFGCDIFGNQFGYDKDGNVFMLYIESAEIEVLAQSFSKFIKLVSENVNYYTGESIAKSWSNISKHPLEISKKLCPIYPFILGGEYEVSKMYELDIFNVLDYSENIASQIFGLPDGVEIDLKLTR